MSNHIGTALKIMRLSSHLSQEELATLADVSQQTVSRWEAGESSPTHEQLVKIAEGTGVSVADLESLREGKAFVQVVGNQSNNNGYNIVSESKELIETNAHLLANLRAQYEARIADLQQQVSDLRIMVEVLKGREDPPLS